MPIAETTPWDVLVPVASAFLGAIVGVIVNSAFLARETVRLNDADARRLDGDLAEWLVIADRELEQALAQSRPDIDVGGSNEIEVRDIALAPTRTLKLYGYREQLLAKRSALARLHASEGSEHRLYRTVFRRPRYELRTPAIARPLITYWMRDTGANQLDWSLEDCISELETRVNFERST